MSWELLSLTLRDYYPQKEQDRASYDQYENAIQRICDATAGYLQGGQHADIPSSIQVANRSHPLPLEYLKAYLQRRGIRYYLIQEDHGRTVMQPVNREIIQRPILLEIDANAIRQEILEREEATWDDVKKCCQVVYDVLKYCFGKMHW